MKAERPKSLRPARQIPIFALSMDEAAAALDVSKPIAYALVERGVLRTFVVGRRRLTTPRALAEAVETLEASAAPMPDETPHNRRAVAAA
jgi:excisionase family DNA binding protein